MIHDAHAHFFSPRFFAFFAEQVAARRGAFTVQDIASATGLEIPDDVPALADRWVRELDRVGVQRMVTIASVPGDQDSVLEAAARHPDRLIPYAMFHPAAAGAREALARAAANGLRGVCLFPAMHRYFLDGEEALAFVATAADHGLVVFVHFGLLKLGLRDRLGLPSPFDLRYSNPISLCAAAQRHPDTAFVIPHFGAGYLREALLLGRQCDNVYLDSSSSNSWTVTQPGMPSLADVFRQAIATLGPERILYGSDSGAFPRGYAADLLAAQSRILEDLDLTAAQREAILGGNLRRLVA